MDSTTTTLLLRTSEVAARLSLSSGTVENWRYLGVGPKFVRLGRTVRYSVDELERWIREEGRQGA